MRTRLALLLAAAAPLAAAQAVLRLPPGSPREQLAGSQTYAIGAVGYVGYTFRNPALLVAGPWTLQVWVQEKKLAEKTFTVTR
jgi:H+/gluconate symporter-like permease